MLLQFSVENFLSFREAGVLSMLAADGIDHPPHMLMDGPEGKKVLRCAAVYGANASGKSNLIKALDFACGLVRTGTRPDARIDVVPFKLTPECREKPSQFDWEIGVDGVRYSYGFQCTTERVIAEWLFATRDGAEEPLFRREGSKIDIGPSLLSARGDFIRFVAEGTRDNQLFLTEARERNVSELGPVFRSLDSTLVVQPSTPAGPIFDLLRRDPHFPAFLKGLLAQAGTGIEDIRLEKEDPLTFLGRLPSGLSTAEVILQRLGSGLWEPSGEDRADRMGLATYRRNTSGQEVRFSVFEESDGTQRLIHLAPALSAISGSPSDLLLGIDELERSLHPLLTRSFLSRCLSAEGTSQLLFTTHDTNLLDLHLLSADAIWLTEKDPTGATALYSLAEYKEEQLASLTGHLEDGYLQGRFGAIPFLGHAGHLGWKKAAE